MKSVKLLIVFLLVCVFSKAQSYNLELYSVENKDSLLHQLVHLPQPNQDAVSVYSFLQSLIPSLQSKGYLAASVDSVSVKDHQYKAFVFLGEVYQWAKVNMDALPENMLSQNGYSKIAWEGKALDARLIAKITEKTLQWEEQHGYPFARVWLDVNPEKNTAAMEAVFRIETGVLQRLDSIHFEGAVKISNNYLLRYLDLKQHEIYNEKKMHTLTNRLNELPFLQTAQPWRMDFKTTGNQLHIFLKERKANTLNAIIGLQPNTVETGKFLLTADAAFLFQNILGKGEYISITYQNLQYKSPRFDAHVTYPYLFNTLVGVDAVFDLYKKDTAFRRTSFTGGLRYQMNAQDFIRVYYQAKSNRLGTVDTAFVKANKQLPTDADVSAKGGGLELSVSRVDNRLQPYKGWEGEINCTVLQRQVRPSDAIETLSDASGFNYASLYDTVALRTNQIFLSGHFYYYFPLAKKTVLKTAYTGAYMKGGNLFRNELYQIGGFRLLRGFDEQSIYTNQYHVLSLELRLLLGQNSYFYFFSDNGWVQSNYSLKTKDDLYNGFGIGATLETKTGLFSISYALGRHDGNPVQFRQSKIHFGYAAYF
jgi:outer membrane protein assembly factor BamA